MFNTLDCWVYPIDKMYPIGVQCTQIVANACALVNTDGRTNGVKPIYPATTLLCGGHNDAANQILWAHHLETPIWSPTNTHRPHPPHPKSNGALVMFYQGKAKQNIMWISYRIILTSHMTVFHLAEMLLIPDQHLISYFDGVWSITQNKSYQLH